MSTFPPDPTPTPVQVAAYLRERAGLAARRGVTLCAHDIDVLLTAATLLDLAYRPLPVLMVEVTE